MTLIFGKMSMFAINFRDSHNLVIFLGQFEIPQHFLVATSLTRALFFYSLVYQICIQHLLLAQPSVSARESGAKKDKASEFLELESTVTLHFSSFSLYILSVM